MFRSMSKLPFMTRMDHWLSRKPLKNDESVEIHSLTLFDIC